MPNFNFALSIHDLKNIYSDYFFGVKYQKMNSSANEW